MLWLAAIAALVFQIEANNIVCDNGPPPLSGAEATTRSQYCYRAFGADKFGWATSADSRWSNPCKDPGYILLPLVQPSPGTTSPSCCITDADYALMAPPYADQFLATMDSNQQLPIPSYTSCLYNRRPACISYQYQYSYAQNDGYFQYGSSPTRIWSSCASDLSTWSPCQNSSTDGACSPKAFTSTASFNKATGVLANQGPQCGASFQLAICVLKTPCATSLINNSNDCVVGTVTSVTVQPAPSFAFWSPGNNGYRAFLLVSSTSPLQIPSVTLSGNRCGPVGTAPTNNLFSCPYPQNGVNWTAVVSYIYLTSSGTTTQAVFDVAPLTIPATFSTPIRFSPLDSPWMTGSTIKILGAGIGASGLITSLDWRDTGNIVYAQCIPYSITSTASDAITCSLFVHQNPLPQNLVLFANASFSDSYAGPLAAIADWNITFCAQSNNSAPCIVSPSAVFSTPSFMPFVLGLTENCKYSYYAPLCAATVELVGYSNEALQTSWFSATFDNTPTSSIRSHTSSYISGLLCPGGGIGGSAYCSGYGFSSKSTGCSVGIYRNSFAASCNLVLDLIKVATYMTLCLKYVYQSSTKYTLNPPFCSVFSFPVDVLPNSVSISISPPGGEVQWFSIIAFSALNIGNTVRDISFSSFSRSMKCFEPTISASNDTITCGLPWLLESFCWEVTYSFVGGTSTQTSKPGMPGMPCIRSNNDALRISLSFPPSGARSSTFNSTLPYPLPSPSILSSIGYGFPISSMHAIVGSTAWVSCSAAPDNSFVVICDYPSTSTQPFSSVDLSVGDVFTISSGCSSAAPATTPSSCIVSDPSWILIPTRKLPAQNLAVNETNIHLVLDPDGATSFSQILQMGMSISILGSPCQRIAINATNNTLVMCIGWRHAFVNETLFVERNEIYGAYEGFFPIELSFSGFQITIPQGLLASFTFPPLLLSATPCAAELGASVLIEGDHFFYSASTVAALWSETSPVMPLPLPTSGGNLSIFVGGYPCKALTLLNPTLVNCTLPSYFSSSIPNYPYLAVTAVNADGVSSVSSNRLVISVPSGYVNVSWIGAPRLSNSSASSLSWWALPSSASPLLAQFPFTHPAAPAVSVAGFGLCLCILSFDEEKMSLVSGTDVANTPLATTSATKAFVSFPAAAAVGSTGASSTLTVSCTDSYGQFGRTALQEARVSVANMSLAWLLPSISSILPTSPESDVAFAVVFSVLRPPDASLALQYDFYLPIFVPGTSYVSCLFALLPANANLGNATSLASALAISYNSSLARSLSASADGVSIVANASLACARCPLDAEVAAYTECTWLASGERFLSPPRRLRIPRVTATLTLNASTSTAAAAVATHAVNASASTTGLVYDAYSTIDNCNVGLSTDEWSVVLGSDASCRIRMVNASTSSARPSDQTLATSFRMPHNRSSASNATWSTTIVLYGPPDAILFLSASCLVFGDYAISSAPVPIVIAPYLVGIAVLSISAPPPFPFVVSALPLPLVNATPVWPSGPLPTQLMPTQLPIVVLAHAQARLSCSLFVASFDCSGAPPGTLSGPYRDAVSLTVGGSTQTVMANDGNLTTPVAFASVGVLAAAGCTVQIAVNCSDGVGRSGSSSSLSSNAVATPASLQAFGLIESSAAGPFGIIVSLNVLALNGAWITNATAFSAASRLSAEAQLSLGYLPPGSLPPLTLSIFGIDTSSGEQAGIPRSAAPLSSLLSCVLAVTDAAFDPSNGASLYDFVFSPLTRENCLSVDSTPSLLGGDAIGMNYLIASSSLSSSSAALGVQYFVHAECTWLPSGDRMQLPPRPFTSRSAFLNVTSVTDRRNRQWPSTAGTASSHAIVILAFTSIRLVSLAWSAEQDAALEVNSCSLNTAPSSGDDDALISTTSSITVVPSSNGTQEIGLNASFAGPPGSSIGVFVSCLIWGVSVRSRTIFFRASNLSISFVGGSTPADVYVPSDATAPWFLPSPAQMRLQDEFGITVAETISCNLVGQVPGLLPVLGAGNVTLSQLISGVDSDASGICTFPPLSFQSDFDFNASFLVSCTRASNDGASALWALTSTKALALDICDQPPLDRRVGASDSLTPFSVSVVAGGCAAAAAAYASSNATTSFTSPVLPLRASVSCFATVSSAAALSATSIFLRGGETIADATTGIATFSDFNLVAPGGNDYTVRVDCGVGNIAIPASPATFPLRIGTCPSGEQASGAFCVKCAMNQFSLGTDCVSCPTTGATCSQGLLTLFPGFFRPPANANVSLEVDSALYVCPFPAACIVDPANFTFSCAPHYSGVLCGVCESGYARNSDGSCSPCPTALYSFGISGFLVIVVLAYMIYLAFKKRSKKSMAGVTLRILLAHVQAVGSLALFKSGGSSVYHSIMDWSSSSSSGEGAFSLSSVQCLTHAPYIVRFGFTLALPFLVGVGVLLSFVLITALRSVRCCVCQTRQACFNWFFFGQRLKAWRKEHAPVASLLLVVYLLYMTIISSSFQALDCTSPINGVSYLRADLSVVCGEGSHVIARALAFAALAFVGVGFPLSLFVLLFSLPPKEVHAEFWDAVLGSFHDGYRVLGSGSSGHSQASAAADPSGYEESGSSIKNDNALFKHKQSALRRDSRRFGNTSKQRPMTQKRVQDEYDDGAPTDRGCLLSRSHTPWWESLVLVRKSGMVLLAINVADAHEQSTGASMFLFAALVLHLIIRPYRYEIFNRLEAASLGSIFVTAICGSSLLQYPDRTSSASISQWVVTIAMLAINIGVIAVLASFYAYFSLGSIAWKLWCRIVDLGGRVASCFGGCFGALFAQLQRITCGAVERMQVCFWLFLARLTPCCCIAKACSAPPPAAATPEAAPDTALPEPTEGSSGTPAAQVQSFRKPRPVSLPTSFEHSADPPSLSAGRKQLLKRGSIFSQTSTGELSTAMSFSALTSRTTVSLQLHLNAAEELSDAAENDDADEARLRSLPNVQLYRRAALDAARPLSGHAAVAATEQSFLQANPLRAPGTERAAGAGKGSSGGSSLGHSVAVAQEEPLASFHRTTNIISGHQANEASGGGDLLNGANPMHHRPTANSAAHAVAPSESTGRVFIAPHPVTASSREQHAKQKRLSTSLFSSASRSSNGEDDVESSSNPMFFSSVAPLASSPRDRRNGGGSDLNESPPPNLGIPQSRRAFENTPSSRGLAIGAALKRMSQSLFDASHASAAHKKPADKSWLSAIGETLFGTGVLTSAPPAAASADEEEGWGEGVVNSNGGLNPMLASSGSDATKLSGRASINASGTAARIAVRRIQPHIVSIAPGAVVPTATEERTLTARRPLVLPRASLLSSSSSDVGEKDETQAFSFQSSLQSHAAVTRGGHLPDTSASNVGSGAASSAGLAPLMPERHSAVQATGRFSRLSQAQHEAPSFKHSTPSTPTLQKSSFPRKAVSALAPPLSLNDDDDPVVMHTSLF